MIRLLAIAALLAACSRSSEPKPAPRPATECADAAACESQCTSGVAESCALWATYLWSDDLDRARELSERACTMGEGLGCQQMAELHAGAHGHAVDEATQRRYLHRAGRLYRSQCDGGDGKACYLLAKLPGRSSRGHQRLMQSACDSGYQPACSE